MDKKPRFYTTSISAIRTVNEIAGLVAEYGARGYGVELDDDRNPVALNFTMRVPSQGEVPVRLEAQIDGIARRLGGDRDQARRTAWRQLKTWVEMQMELVENEVRAFHEVFLADIVMRDGRRIGSAFEEWSGRLIGSHRAVS